AYVETVAALALSEGSDKFYSTLRALRYEEGSGRYVDRHFLMEGDWIRNNLKAGWLKDISAKVGGKDALPIQASIRKIDWFNKQRIVFKGAVPSSWVTQQT